MSNLSSIYYNSPSNFDRLILGSSKQTDLTPGYDVMKGIFREASNLKKDDIISHSITAKIRPVKEDSVLAKVGNSRLWDLIIYKLNKKFPRRNYNRSVEVPEYVILSELEDLIEKVNHKASEILAPERQQILNELSNVRGFIDTPEQKEEEIKARLQSKISSHKDMQPIITRIQNLIDESKL